SRAGFGVQPAFGSFLYLRQPLVRTPVQNSGSAATVCGGQFSFDFNDWVQNGFDGGLTAGTTVWAQYWSRDPGDPDGAHLGDVIRFTLAP
ncbi:MAG: hypothetical protein KDC95_24125, partial [Planctomycetes bacterium]|nr:hypothetical protein [Planctomycetota bacterium]